MGSFSETLAPETQAGKETTGDGVTKAVKPMVVKRSSESVISLENSRTGTSFNPALCEGRDGAGWQCRASIPNVFSMTRPLLMSSMPRIDGKKLYLDV
jgi:hypothetical protein